MPETPTSELIAALEVEERELVRRLAALQSAIETLRSVRDEGPFLPVHLPDLKLTNAIRHIVRQAGGAAVSALKVRDELRKLGFAGEQYRNLRSIVHIVLRRTPEVKKVKDEETGHSAYAWKVSRIPGRTR